MTYISSPTSSTSALLTGTGVSSPKGASSTSDIISSFKQILSTMTAMNGISSGQSAGVGMNMGDLMAPLMLLLIERLVEQQLGQESSAATATASATGQTAGAASAPVSTGTVTGSRPEPSGRPVTGGWISQGFHAGHRALDFAVPTGTSVRSTMDGNVVYAGWNDQGYGNLVIVENGEYRTYYAHLSNIPVSVGDKVTAGSTIGISGNTGHSTGPHLHYEIRRNKVAIDPTSATLGDS